MALPAIILLAALVVVPAAVVRRQWTLTCGFAAAGAGVALQSPVVYRLVDPLLGGWNLTNLLYHLLTVAGIGGFLLLVLTADPRWDARRATRIVVGAVAVACGVEVALFIVGIRTEQWAIADSHLSDQVTSPVFLSYASILWIALAGLAVAAIVTQQAQTRGRPWSVGRVGLTLVVLGCVASLGWCVNAAAIAVTAVLRGQEPAAGDRVGQLLALVGGGAVFAGLATTNLPHLVDRLDGLRLGLAIRPVWRRAVAAAPEVALRSGARASLGGRATLYRRWVEIEDAVRLGRLALTGQERSRVGQLERMFAPASRPARPEGSAVTGR
ncbi:DUF6545 domain-containing protein [Amnibacterium endophyticum]|uniref:DUF6545 domain-containing protein n=1 Tax=Amnibacterium endophyticum TaxID=2109337 RepID=A0ABW4LG16_9MICO